MNRRNCNDYTRSVGNMLFTEEQRRRWRRERRGAALIALGALMGMFAVLALAMYGAFNLAYWIGGLL